MARSWEDSAWPTQWVRIEREQVYLARNILPPPESWMERGACVGRWPMWDRTIDGEGERARLARQREAARVCRTACPVLAECRAWSEQAATIGDFGVCAGRVVRGAINGRGGGDWVELGGGGSMPRAS